MKGLIMGVAGLTAVGGAAYVTTGGKGAVDDYVGIVNKSPQEVYAALANIGPDGVTQLPTNGPGAPRITRKITKVAGKSVKVEVTLDDQTFASVEFDVEPADGGKTRLAGEVDLDTAVINRAVQARGGPALPFNNLSEGMIDQAFSLAMERTVQTINDGGVSLAALGQGQSGFASFGMDGGPHFGSGSGMSAMPTWSSRPSLRPQVSARPTASTTPAIDPNRAVADHLRAQNQVQQPGW